jgi:hypothetical protein
MVPDLESEQGNWTTAVEVRDAGVWLVSLEVGGLGGR